MWVRSTLLIKVRRERHFQPWRSRAETTPRTMPKNNAKKTLGNGAHNR
jgi:hypothetical protein